MEKFAQIPFKDILGGGSTLTSSPPNLPKKKFSAYFVHLFIEKITTNLLNEIKISFIEKVIIFNVFEDRKKSVEAFQAFSRFNHQHSTTPSTRYKSFKK